MESCRSERSSSAGSLVQRTTRVRFAMNRSTTSRNGLGVSASSNMEPGRIDRSFRVEVGGQLKLGPATAARAHYRSRSPSTQDVNGRQNGDKPT